MTVECSLCGPLPNDVFACPRWHLAQSLESQAKMADYETFGLGQLGEGFLHMQRLRPNHSGHALIVEIGQGQRLFAPNHIQSVASPYYWVTATKTHIYASLMSIWQMIPILTEMQKMIK